MKRICILGSTGSIGRSALDVIRRHPDRFEIVALVAGRDEKKLEEQAKEFKPKRVVLAQRDGEEAVVEAATLPEVDIVLSAIVGVAGLKPTYAALRSGKKVALANKESLVAAGAVMTQAMQAGGGSLIPVDSEHSAIHQVLGEEKKSVSKIILTASGGPFRNFTKEALEKVTVEQALAHPNWTMGNKITIDSATMMNKGLEVIEAHWLFDILPQKIEVKIHPQSIIHSLVEFIDGSVLAQLGNPDMRTPIAYALAYPERISTDVVRLDLVKSSPLTFEEPDLDRFPCLRLAQNALEAGKSAPCVLNSANEVAVGLFLERRLPFTGIAKIVEKVLMKHQPYPLTSLEDVLEVDKWGRDFALTLSI